MPKEQCRPGVSDALRAVADYPRRVGSPRTNIYIEKPTTNRPVVSFIAVHEGAADITGDPAIQFVGLERNPNILGKENVAVLTVGRLSNGVPEQSRAEFDNYGNLVHAENTIAVAQSGKIFEGIVSELKLER